MADPKILMNKCLFFLKKFFFVSPPPPQKTVCDFCKNSRKDPKFQKFRRPRTEKDERKLVIPKPLFCFSLKNLEKKVQASVYFVTKTN